MTGNVLTGKILVRQDQGGDKTEAGIIIPDAYREKKKSGEVVLVGGSSDRINMECKPGDHVLFAEHAGTELILDEGDISLKGEFVLLNQTDVLFYKRKN